MMKVKSHSAPQNPVRTVGSFALEKMSKQPHFWSQGPVPLLVRGEQLFGSDGHHAD